MASSGGTPRPGAGGIWRLWRREHGGNRDHPAEPIRPQRGRGGVRRDHSTIRRIGLQRGPAGPGGRGSGLGRRPGHLPAVGQGRRKCHWLAARLVAPGRHAQSHRSGPSRVRPQTPGGRVRRLAVARHRRLEGDLTLCGRGAQPARSASAGHSDLALPGRPFHAGDRPCPRPFPGHDFASDRDGRRTASGRASQTRHSRRGRGAGHSLG